MTSWIRYWIKRLDDGTVSHLVRIRNIDGVGTLGEFFQDDGQWHADNWAMTYLYDPLRGDEISASEAEEVVRQLGRSWPGLDHGSGAEIS